MIPVKEKHKAIICLLLRVTKRSWWQEWNMIKYSSSIRQFEKLKYGPRMRIAQVHYLCAAKGS